MVRDWLKTYKGGIYESYSVCEVILVDDLFADMRDCVSWADAFISHADSEPYLGWGNANGLDSNNGTGRETTMGMLANCAVNQLNQGKQDLRLDSYYTKDGKGYTYMWVDYFSLRPNVREWQPKVVIDLVARIGTVVALVDKDMQFLSRSWCVFELFAAIKGKTNLVCQYQGGRASHVEAQLKKTPVDAAKTECSQDEDKKMIDDYIRNLPGGFGQFNADLDRTIRASNNLGSNGRPITNVPRLWGEPMSFNF